MRFRFLTEGGVFYPSLLLGPSVKGRQQQPPFLLVNPVEGLSRASSHLRKLRIEHFLFTRTSWRHSFAGLPAVLTHAIKSNKQQSSLWNSCNEVRTPIYFHGPPGSSRNLFKALQYVLSFEDKSLEFLGVEPLASQITTFRIRENDPPGEVRDCFEDKGIRIEHLPLESDSLRFPSENLYPAWNNLSIDYKDEVKYSSAIPRNRIATSFLISDSESKFLVLDIPDDSYLESLFRVIPSVEADVVFNLSSADVRREDLYIDWSASAISGNTRVFNLRDLNSKDPPPRVVYNKLKEIYPPSALRLYTDNDCYKSEEFPNLTFLGTGSKRSHAHRNVSGILLRVSPSSCGLLDCGEGTYRQLMDAFGPQGTSDILKNLRFIFISHRHNDHHLGLFTILQERERLFVGESPPKVYLIAPRSFKSLLKHYHGLLEDVHNSIFHINSMRLLKGSHKFLLGHLYKKFCEDTSLESAETLIAEHIKNSHGLCVAAGGWKVLYTGDTKPNPRLKDTAPDVLIHEATLPSYLGPLAHTQLHSTTEDALQAMSLSKAGFLILTHFSEAHGAVIPHPEPALAQEDNVGIAFDFMRVSPGTLKDIALSQTRFKALTEVFEKEVAALAIKERKWTSKNYF